MLAHTSYILRLAFPMQASCSCGTAAFATFRKTHEKLSTAVSVASKRIPKPAEETQKPQKEKKARAPTAYTLFVKDHIAEMRASSSAHIATKDMFRAAGDKWKSLPDLKKQIYLDEAAKLKAVIEKDRAVQKANARPINPYAKFVQELVPSLKATYPGLGATELLKRVAASWKLVSISEKKRRHEHYLASVAEWKAKHASDAS